MRKIRYAAAVSALLCAVFALSGCSLFRKKSDDLLPHLIEAGEENPVRPIDAVTQTEGFSAGSLSAQFDELVQIVYRGYRPDFTAAQAEVKAVYDAAVAICNRYIRNDFSEYERVHALHDWLAYYTQYDMELLQENTADPSHPSFRLDGVFVHGKAVCDGIAKAFMLLCGIERISCIRVTGWYDQDGKLINHAWNKVRLSGVWYNVDATMDVWHVRTGADTGFDVMHHGYFLISDEAIRDETTGRHTQSDADSVDYACTRNYDFHKTVPLGVGDYSMEITSQSELNDVFSRAKSSKGKIGRLELRLRYPEYDESNLRRPDAYLTQITEAYGKVRDADYALDPSENVYPYQRYPNGVFVFLIYK